MNIQKEEATAFWDGRYKEEDYAYGVEPSYFLKKHLPKLNESSKVLFPAEGEGRNAVYTATHGHSVYAFDYSTEGRKKALKLAANKHVQLNYALGGLEDLIYEPETFDAVVLVYAHFFPPIRASYHKKLVSLLKPGGFLILEGFSKAHIEFNKNNAKSGGPKNIEMLFSKTMLLDDFSSLDCLELEISTQEINEGNYHNGLASIITFLGQKSKNS